MNLSKLRGLYCFSFEQDEKYVTQTTRARVLHWLMLAPGRGKSQLLINWCRAGRIDVLNELDDLLEERFPQLVLQPGYPGISTKEQLLRQLVSCEGRKGYTPLIAASRAGKDTVIFALLRMGAPRMYTDKKQMTALSHACSKGHASCVEALMQPSSHGEIVARLVDMPAVACITPLHFACARGHTKVVDALLDHAPELNARISSYHYIQGFSFQPMFTPLHLCAKGGHGDCIISILKSYMKRRDSEQTSDPRLARVKRVLPYEMAKSCIQMRENDALHMLHPSTDLFEFFPDIVNNQVGVPRLSLLCAPVVRSSLMDSLSRASVCSSRFHRASEMSVHTAKESSNSRLHMPTISSLNSHNIQGLIDAAMREQDERSSHSSMARVSPCASTCSTIRSYTQVLADVPEMEDGCMLEDCLDGCPSEPLHQRTSLPASLSSSTSGAVSQSHPQPRAPFGQHKTPRTRSRFNAYPNGLLYNSLDGSPPGMCPSSDPSMGEGLTLSTNPSGYPNRGSRSSGGTAPAVRRTSVPNMPSSTNPSSVPLPSTFCFLPNPLNPRNTAPSPFPSPCTSSSPHHEESVRPAPLTTPAVCNSPADLPAGMVLSASTGKTDGFASVCLPDPSLPLASQSAFAPSLASTPVTASISAAASSSASTSTSAATAAWSGARAKAPPPHRTTTTDLEGMIDCVVHNNIWFGTSRSTSKDLDDVEIDEDARARYEELHITASIGPEVSASPTHAAYANDVRARYEEFNASIGRTVSASPAVASSVMGVRVRYEELQSAASIGPAVSASPTHAAYANDVRARYEEFNASIGRTVSASPTHAAYANDVRARYEEFNASIGRTVSAFPAKAGGTSDHPEPFASNIDLEVSHPSHSIPEEAFLVPVPGGGGAGVSFATYSFSGASSASVEDPEVSYPSQSTSEVALPLPGPEALTAFPGLRMPLPFPGPGGEGDGSGALPTRTSAASSSDSECGICFAGSPDMAIAGCHHRLCISCAEELCKRVDETPAHCPFCRTIIRGFEAPNTFH